MGLLVGLLGVYTCYRFFSHHSTALGVISVIVTLYQFSSLREMARSDDRVQTLINMAATLIIIILFVLSFFF